MSTNFTRTELGLYSTVSEQLKRARTDRHLTLADCAQRLGIQEKYLTAIESSQYSLLPGEMYTKAWIKKYANFLGVSTQDIMISYDKENGIRAKLERAHGVERKRILSRLSSLITGRRIAALIALALVMGYAAFIIHESISPPEVTFEGTVQDFRTQENSIILKGQTEPGVTITINTEPVVLDTNNAFNQEISLIEGLNSITIEAKKKHSRSFIKEFTVVRTALPTVITTSTPTSTATTTGPNQ